VAARGERAYTAHTRLRESSILERICIVMIATPEITIENQPVVQSKNGWSPLWHRLGLAVVMLVSIFMNFYQLGQNGFGNLYYAAAIRSMLDNWRNFFFVSLDPGGFVSIDKPPLGFWLQAASAK